MKINEIVTEESFMGRLKSFFTKGKPTIDSVLNSLKSVSPSYTPPPQDPLALLNNLSKRRATNRFNSMIADQPNLGRVYDYLVKNKMVYFAYRALGMLIGKSESSMYVIQNQHFKPTVDPKQKELCQKSVDKILGSVVNYANAHKSKEKKNAHIDREFEARLSKWANDYTKATYRDERDALQAEMVKAVEDRFDDEAAAYYGQKIIDAIAAIERKKPTIER